MRVPFFQLDAFASERFGGNPAAVMLFDAFPEAETMQRIAAENNLSETAFLVPHEGEYRLRWFTPKVEVPLCGHGTLASAAVVFERLAPTRSLVTFQTASGPLPVRREGSSYVLDFPARRHEQATAPRALLEALRVDPREVLRDAFNYLVVFDHAQQVRGLSPDLALLQTLDRTGVIVTAPGDEGYDCVSRYFAPAKGIPEDPVTGAAHCALTPYWCARLGTDRLRAWQASARGGRLQTRLRGDRVELSGEAVFYLEGHASL